MNKVILEGIVDTEPEVCYFGSNHLRLDFKLYTEELISTANEGQRTLRLHHHIVIWDAEVAKEAEVKLHKGQRVHIEGRISYVAYHKAEELRSSMQIECKHLSILSDIEGNEERRTLAPTVEIDWSNFSPTNTEDPMA